MTQVALFGLKTAAVSAVFGAIVSGAAWGTRYVSQIPTQDIVAAGIAGSGTTLVSILLNNALVYAFHGKLVKHLTPDPKTLGQEQPTFKDELTKQAKLIITSLSFGFAFLASTGAAPTVASLVGRNISYQAAALFSLLNLFSLCVFVLVFASSTATNNNHPLQQTTNSNFN